jgi:hypothetical protein
VISLAEGRRERRVAIRSETEGGVVAWGEYAVPTRGRGLSALRIRLDPEHATLAPFLVKYLLHRAVTSSPGLRVELSVPQWMEATVAAAEGAGFERRLAYCRMGLAL